ncbi:MAG TPA: hypothetical protein VED87_01660, partial [Methylocystis sp.]|nr:hypothetical protein [Methylocystis sp.]
MSFLRSRAARPRVSASALAFLVAALAPTAGEAREDGRRGEVAASAEELPLPSRRGYEDLILIMEPLRPATGPNAAKRILPQEAGPASTIYVMAPRPEPKVERPVEEAVKTKAGPAPAALVSAPAEAIPVANAAPETLASDPGGIANTEAAAEPQTEVPVPGMVPGLTEGLALAFAHRSAAQPAPDFSLVSLELLLKPDLESTGLMSFLPAAAQNPEESAQVPASPSPQIRAPESAEAPRAA